MKNAILFFFKEEVFKRLSPEFTLPESEQILITNESESVCYASEYFVLKRLYDHQVWFFAAALDSFLLNSFQEIDSGKKKEQIVVCRNFFTWWPLAIFIFGLRNKSPQ